MKTLREEKHSPLNDWARFVRVASDPSRQSRSKYELSPSLRPNVSQLSALNTRRRRCDDEWFFNEIALVAAAAAVAAPTNVAADASKTPRFSKRNLLDQSHVFAQRNPPTRTILLRSCA